MSGPTGVKPRPIRPADAHALYAVLRRSLGALLVRWLAERDGPVVGDARSMRRGDTRQLTESFVLPEAADRDALGWQVPLTALPGAFDRYLLTSPPFFV